MPLWGRTIDYRSIGGDGPGNDNLEVRCPHCLAWTFVDLLGRVEHVNAPPEPDELDHFGDPVRPASEIRADHEEDANKPWKGYHG